MHVKRVVDVKTGENGKDISLEEGDQDLQAGQGHDHGQRQDAKYPHDADEPGNHFDQGVPG